MSTFEPGDGLSETETGHTVRRSGNGQYEASDKNRQLKFTTSDLESLLPA